MGNPLFERTDPYTEDEQRAIDQQGLLFPDYCVCLRPNEVIAKVVCQAQAALVEDPSLGNIYPNDSEQIEWVRDFHEPYDFCYDIWSTDGVSFEPDGESTPAEEMGDEYIRPEQTQEEKDFFLWQDAFTSDIKWNAYNMQKAALEDWNKESGDKGPPPRQFNLEVNGYWNETGYCTCYEPNFLPPALITTFQVLGAIWQIDT